MAGVDEMATRRLPADGSGLGRNFKRLWSAAAVSSVGDGVQYAAMPLLATRVTHDPVLVGAVSAGSTVPWLLFSLQVGALVDRWDRRAVMWRADALRFLLLLGFAALVLSGHASIAVVIATAFLLGCGQVFFDIAAQAMVPSILPDDPDKLMRANGRMNAVQDAGGRLVGPPLGASLFPLAGFIPFLGNALSFAFSALRIRSITGAFTPSAPSEMPVRRNLRQDIAEGLRWMFGNRVIRALAFTAALGNMVFSAKMALLILLARTRLGLDDSGYGYLLAATAIGSFGGSYAAPWIGKRIGPGVMRCLGMTVEGLSVAGIGLTRNPWMAGLMMAVIGCSMATQMVVVGSVRQRVTPPAMLGRVLSASRLISVAGVPAGALLGGWIAGATSIRVPFVLGGALMVGVAIVSLPVLGNRAIEKATEGNL